MVHASRLAEDIALWAGRAARLPDAWATGSSMLPQKRNPDVAELVRGRAGTVLGRLTGFLATLKGLPLAYARDLQEDKAAAFEARDLLVGSLAALAGLVAGLEPDRDAMRRDAEATETTAVDLAEALVRDGVPSARPTPPSPPRSAWPPPAGPAWPTSTPESWPRSTPPLPPPTAPSSAWRAAWPPAPPRLHQPLLGRRPAGRPRGRRLSRSKLGGYPGPRPGSGPTASPTAGERAGTGRPRSPGTSHPEATRTRPSGGTAPRPVGRRRP